MAINKLQNKSIAPLVVVLAAVAAIFIIALIFFEDNFRAATRNGAKGAEDPQVRMLKEQSQSDEIFSIENDLNNTNLGDIDQGLDQINQNSSSLSN